MHDALQTLGLKVSEADQPKLTRIDLLDQQALPDHEVWVDATAPETMISAIRALKVRGAPLIGVAAALCLGHYARSHVPEAIQLVALALRQARPTAVNLMWAIDRLMQLPAEAMWPEALAILQEDINLCQRMGTAGADLLANGDGVLTHCNTGGLATAGIGTALGVIRTAWEQGKELHVYVDETRPLLQGGRLTTWELEHLNIPYTLITDNMAAMLMQQGKVQKVITGADRIARNGDSANKIGTYSVAVNAHYHQIPFYIAAPYSTLDATCASGSEIPIETRAAEEVQGVVQAQQSLRWAPATAPVYNPAFDVTPASLISAWITDQGVFTSAEALYGSGPV
ncbi:MAG: S-methyl-5-thioribose-1-phosphate isomerase [Candidatus Sericytochromatia bacterium]|nr:S-methyl-5-thioribose-1-phosphate isomerase [Candidatus Sericytochromatia bacterium]